MEPSKDRVADDCLTLKMRRLIKILPLLFLFCQKEKTVEQTEIIFGSYFRVKVNGEEKILNKALAEVLSEMKRYNDLFTIFSDSSEVSQLNRYGRIKASKDLITIIKKAKEIGEATDGAFTVTIYPLMAIWGFYQKSYRLPEEKEIVQKKELVGDERLVIKGDSVYLLPGTKIDLGGIAVGYAIDRAYEILKRWGIKKGLIDGGGDIFVFGTSYKIGVKNPRKEGVIETLNLKDEAVSTSGDYENYFEIGGRRFSHIIDPRTGYPKEGVMSVTVFGKEAIICDALSTALFVLGEKGREYIKKFSGYQAILYLSDGQRVKW